MNFRIISALVMRYIFLYTRTPMRLVELVFWPMVDLLIWGYLTIYIKENAGSGFSHMISFLLGAMILWDVVFRAQQGVAVSFLEDVWTRNLLNIFVAPVRTSEYLIATFCVGILRICVTVVIMCLVALSLYQFNILTLGWPLLPFFVNLLISGWALGMISTALILRWGQAAESLAWAVPFFIQPISAVFYPVGSIRPEWLQKVALALPTTHVFEGMRAVLAGQATGEAHMMLGIALALFYILLACLYFLRTYRRAVQTGLIARYSAENAS